MWDHYQLNSWHQRLLFLFLSFAFVFFLPHFCFLSTASFSLSFFLSNSSHRRFFLSSSWWTQHTPLDLPGISGDSRCTSLPSTGFAEFSLSPWQDQKKIFSLYLVGAEFEFEMWLLGFDFWDMGVCVGGSDLWCGCGGFRSEMWVAVMGSNLWCGFGFDLGIYSAEDGYVIRFRAEDEMEYPSSDTPWAMDFVFSCFQACIWYLY